MKRIKDFSKIIGFIGRGGAFYPSNEAMEERYKKVFEVAGVRPQHILDRAGLRWFRDRAMEQGYKLLVHERGLNR